MFFVVVSRGNGSLAPFLHFSRTIAAILPYFLTKSADFPQSFQVLPFGADMMIVAIKRLARIGSP